MIKSNHLDKKIRETIPFVKTELGYDHPLITKRLIEKMVTDLKQLFLSLMNETVGEDESEDILGILGTRHIDGEINKGRNQLRQQIRERLKDILGEV